MQVFGVNVQLWDKAEPRPFRSAPVSLVCTADCNVCIVLLRRDWMKVRDHAPRRRCRIFSVTPASSVCVGQSLPFFDRRSWHDMDCSRFISSLFRDVGLSVAVKKCPVRMGRK